ncbi:RND family transporter [Dubosiella muris]|uniref:Antibiotic ABC transporter permease n=2 Tax=Dubosiella TaxID=1937008 RepID=A0AC61R8Y8_9FIRM|nr:MMPL family transporter [Dubosiella muris]TGY66376.1 antibiotic ABC transporter permease [Dubosiella muris]
MEKLSKFIVRYRKIILILSIVLLIPSVFGYLNTKVNYDILSYLPADSESMQAQDILNDDFNLSSVDMLVVNGMKDKDVLKLKKEIQDIKGVDKVIWRDDATDISVPKEAIPENIQKMLYSGDSTMLIITFKEPTASDTTMNAIAQIKKYAQMDCYLAGFSAITEDTKDLVNQETPIYSLIAVLLCLVVLCLGLKSWVAPIVFLIGIMFPIIYNMGTNVFLGQISYITQALALILQLAVTMDYSIFLLHRYQEEKTKTDTKEDAMSKAIHATFVSITSSSVTTIAGFLALCAMQLTLGRDIGIVMAKGVILGVVCTVLVLPSLLMAFDKSIEKYTHPVLIKPLKRTPKFVSKHYKAILIAFVLLFIPAIYCQANVGQYYDLTQTLPAELPSVEGTSQLKEKFNMTTTHFVVLDDKVPTKDIQTIIDRIENVKGVTNVLGYEKYIGPGVPSTFEPKAVQEILHNGGKRLIVVNSDYRAATDQENAQLDEIDNIIHEYDKDAKIAGEGALTRDLIQVTNIDFQMVNVVSIVAILLIIAITFKSFSLPFILVLAIEFAICVNMGIPFLTHTQLPFIAGIVIGTIQLGACIDYAILMTTRFKEELQNGLGVKEAVATSIRMTSPSIITSGLSFFAACSGVAMIAKMDMIAALCQLLGRGALISVIVILVVLPSMLIVSQKLIQKTTKNWPVAKGE